MSKAVWCLRSDSLPVYPKELLLRTVLEQILQCGDYHGTEWMADREASRSADSYD